MRHIALHQVGLGLIAALAVARLVEAASLPPAIIGEHSGRLVN